MPGTKFKPEFSAVDLALQILWGYSLELVALRTVIYAMFLRSHKLSIGLRGLFWVFCAQRALSADELPSIMDLQRAYVEANGGVANIQALSSLIASGGILDAEGNEYEFKLYRKRPDMMRIQVDRPGGTLETVFDGRRAFSILSSPGGDDEVSDLDLAERDRLRTDSSMDGLFFQLRSRPEWLEVVAEVEVDGRPAYKIKIKKDADSSYDQIWLGKEHYQEVKLSRTIQVADEGGMKDGVEEIYFSEFEQIRGVWLARTVRYERDGRLTQTVRIERIRANVGVFDSIFKRPEN